MFRLPSRVPSKKLLPLLAGSIALNAIFTPVLFAEGTAPVTTPATNPEAVEPHVIEPLVSAVQVTSLQIEPGSGNLALQTSGAFLSPMLDTSAWPNQLSITLPDTSLNPEFTNTPDEWLNSLKNVMPEATGIQVTHAANAQKPAVTIVLTFQGLAADAPKPQVLVNTGALLTVGLRPFDPEVSRKGVSRMMSSLVGLSNVQTVKPVNLNSLYAYFASIDPGQESTTKVDGLVFQAWREFLAGNDGNAILALRPYVDRVPDDTAARYLLASAYIASGEYGTADKELTMLLLQHQESLPIVLQLLQVKLMEAPDAVRNDKTIQPLLLEALRKWPNTAALYAAQAKYTMASGSLDNARQQILQAITHDPKPEYYNLLGDLEVRAGNPNAAKVAYLDALAIEPSEHESRVKLAMLENGSNNPLAVRDYAKAFSPSWLLSYSKALEQNNQHPQALAVLKMADLAMGDAKSYALIDQNKPVVYELGMRFAEFKENAEAQRNLKLFLELSNLKPDSQSSENAKRVPAAKEMLQRLAYSMPATTRSGGGKASSKKSTVTVKPAAPIMKESPVKEAPSATVTSEKTEPARHAAISRSKKQPAATPPVQAAETTSTPKTPVLTEHSVPSQASEKPVQATESIKPTVTPVQHAQPVEAHVTASPVTPPPAQNATLPSSSPSTSVHIPAIQQPEPITQPLPKPTAIAPAAIEQKPMAVPVKDTQVTQAAISSPKEKSPEPVIKPVIIPEPQAEAKIDVTKPVLPSAPEVPAVSPVTSQNQPVPTAIPQTNAATPEAKPPSLEPLPGARQMESIPSPYYPQGGSFE